MNPSQSPTLKERLDRVATGAVDGLTLDNPASRSRHRVGRSGGRQRLLAGVSLLVLMVIGTAWLVRRIPAETEPIDTTWADDQGIPALHPEILDRPAEERVVTVEGDDGETLATVHVTGGDAEGEEVCIEIRAATGEAAGN